jgi:hypothetical protein
MNTQEFSTEFDTLLNSYNTIAPFGEQSSKAEIVLDEYEKSVFLTQSQKELVVNLYSGKNPYGEAFEGTEEMRRYLDALVKTKVFTMADALRSTGVSANSVFFQLPDDLAFITMEQITYDDEKLGCYNGSTADVYPVTQDEYSRVKDNPFRGPTKYKAIRLDSGDKTVELVLKYDIKEYLIKYLSKPEPIILETLPNGLTIEGASEQTECKLNSILHHTILERAVQMALQSKGISVK